jgi:hypothetical protein
VKGAIIVFIIALALTCWVPALMGFKSPAYPAKAGIVGVAQPPLASGMKRGDMFMPEVKVTDGYQGVYVMTRVGDRDNDQPATQFPLGGIQY